MRDIVRGNGYVESCREAADTLRDTPGALPFGQQAAWLWDQIREDGHLQGNSIGDTEAIRRLSRYPIALVFEVVSDTLIVAIRIEPDTTEDIGKTFL